MDLNKIKVKIPQKDFATASNDYLLGFQAGVEAALKAVADSAIDGLPTVTKEEGLAMRTGQALPNGDRS